MCFWSTAIIGTPKAILSGRSPETQKKCLTNTRATLFVSVKNITANHPPWRSHHLDLLSGSKSQSDQPVTL